jgi:nucleotide-binding universal stress UspA family protein
MSALVRIGDVVDGFRVEERLHDGGMAELYAVSSPGQPFPLLMKVPRVGHGEPVTSVMSHETEATVLAAARGPHVPRFVAAGDLARTPYVVMERIEGRPLSSWLPDAPVAPAEVARLGAALASALHDLHLQELVHLDVKPSNVIVRPGGEVVLVDFGLAFHAHYPDLLAEEFRRPIGTAAYMAPEQVVGERGDPRSDVFALGVVLYQLATGSLPFGSPSSPRALRARLWRDPVPPRALAPSVPEWLQEVILRCLEPDADERYATAAQVALDLGAPEGVAVTERGLRRGRLGLAARIRRWATALGDAPAPGASPRARLARGPVVLVAVATTREDETRFEALREGVRRILAHGTRARLACVAVIPPSAELAERDEDTATRRRIRHLAILRQFAAPLRLPSERLSAHVLEASDPADAILAYARANAVDHIVIGAAPGSVPAVVRGSTVSMRVAAAAACTVTLVRPSAARPGPSASRGGGSPDPSSPGGTASR